MPASLNRLWRCALCLSLLGFNFVLPQAIGVTLDELLNDCHPNVRKWATVVRVEHPETKPEFRFFHYKDSKDSVEFWPASTIKIYTVIAAVEWLNARNLPIESTIIFHRQLPTGKWIQDCARTVPEMVSEVFRRSSNEDYTLLLRMIGIDSINTQFLIPAKGFPHSALMRDYVTYRPVIYENEEPQKIVVQPADGSPTTFQHKWSGISYAEERGATVLSSKTGNCTSTHELADCLRRILFHEKLPKRERFEISAEQARWIREGDSERGLVGLENKLAGPCGWEKSGELVFPNARFFHKGGLISTYALDVCYVSDTDSGNHLILSLAAKSGKPQVIRDMALKIYRAAKGGAFAIVQDE